MAGGHQAAGVETAPHLTAEPARLEAGGTGPVDREDVDHRVEVRQPHERLEVGGAQDVDSVAAGGHERSLGQGLERADQEIETSATAPSTLSMPSAMRMASSMRVSTICDSGTVLMTSPLTKI